MNIGIINFTSYHNLTPSHPAVAEKFEIRKLDDRPNSIYAVTLSADKPVAIGPCDSLEKVEKAALAHLNGEGSPASVSCMHLEITGIDEPMGTVHIRAQMTRRYQASSAPGWGGSRTEHYTVTGKICHRYAAEERDVELGADGEYDHAEHAAVFSKWSNDSPR